MGHERNKVSFVWVLVVFMISISMVYADASYARTVQDFYKEQDLAKQQTNIDFPVLNYWQAGSGENAIWVDPRQTISVPDMPGLVLNTPEYKINLDGRQPETKMMSHNRIYQNTAKIRLFSWN